MIVLRANKALTFCFPLLMWSTQSLFADERPTKTITDIAHWNHPVRAVFQSNKVEISKVEFQDDGRYPVFFAKLTYDPTSSQTDKFYKKFYYNVLKANGFWDYAINDAEDQLIIKIHWDKKAKSMTTTLEDTVDKKD